MSLSNILYIRIIFINMTVKEDNHVKRIHSNEYSIEEKRI